uniref:Uncharacterized protein n=1 Tax=Octactis speculum TaxID=3111310 RepID=A0A7S2CMN1_9STRA
MFFGHVNEDEVVKPPMPPPEEPDFPESVSSPTVDGQESRGEDESFDLTGSPPEESDGAETRVSTADDDILSQKECLFFLPKAGESQSDSMLSQTTGAEDTGAEEWQSGREEREIEAPVNGILTQTAGAEEWQSGEGERANEVPVTPTKSDVPSSLLSQISNGIRLQNSNEALKKALVDNGISPLKTIAAPVTTGRKLKNNKLASGNWVLKDGTDEFGQPEWERVLKS